MAEIFGAAAAGLAVCTQLTQCAIAIYKATKRIKNARLDVLELSDEAVFFAGLCEDFLRTCAQDHKAEKGATSVTSLIPWLKQIKTRLSELLEKVEALIRDPGGRHSWEAIAIAHLEWFGCKSKVKGLRASLNIARASISGYSNLMCIQKLNEELQMLRTALRDVGRRERIEQDLGMSIEEKIKMIEQAIEIKGSVHYTNKRLLKDAKEENMIDQEGKRTSGPTRVPTSFMDFIYTLEAYEEEVLPPAHVAPRNTLNRTHSHNPHRRMTTTQPSKAASEAPAKREPVNPKLVKKKDGKETTSTPPNVPEIVEYRDTRPREYMNDPNGIILSHPNTKAPVAKHPNLRVWKIGYHIIILSTTGFRIDNHFLRVTKYDVADAFFEAVVQHKDKIDTLVEVLGGEIGAEVWNGIPGWLVDSRGVTKDSNDWETENL